MQEICWGVQVSLDGFYLTLVFDSPLPVVQTFHHTDSRISFGQMSSLVVALLFNSV